MSARWMAVTEVLTVYAAGSVLGVLLAKIAGVDLRNPLTVLAGDPGADLLPLCLDLGVILFWQYAGWLICATTLRLARGPRAGLAPMPAVRHSPQALTGLGLAAAALTTAPAVALSLVQETFGLGQTAPWRAALLARPWDPDFWLFMAIGSFGLIPFIEEGFYRGYVLGRSARDLSPAAAVVFTSALFAFSHGQYLRPDALNLLTLGSVLFSGLVYALVTRYTGSLWPAVMAHVVINVPMASSYQGAYLGLLVAGLAVSFPRWAGLRRHAADLFRAAAPRETAVLFVAGAGFAVSFQAAGEVIALVALLVWLGLLAAGVVTAVRGRALPATRGTNTGAGRWLPADGTLGRSHGDV